MKVQVNRKSGKQTLIPTALFIVSADDYKKEFFRQQYIRPGSIIDLPEENINAAIQRNPDLEIINLDVNVVDQTMQQNMNNNSDLDVMPKPVKQKK